VSSYRLDVISVSVADAVRYAGGLMFDRGRAGWRVVVVTEDLTQSTALTILGARTQPPGQPELILGKPGRMVRTRILSGATFSVNRRTARVGLPRVESGPQQLFWGPHLSCETAATVHPVRHELSPAARTFKAHALHAAGLDTHVDPSEEFWSTDALDPALPVESSLESQTYAGEFEDRPPSPTLMGG
jgi:hypothetical protein